MSTNVRLAIASAAKRVALPLFAYLLLEWLFAYVTVAEGLVTPRGRPNLDVVAIGAAYLALRITVRLAAPSIVVFTLVTAWLRARRAPEHASI
jgi:hypothetical protein